MVNVPPIPPLLCSTPPPIDFGDEDDLDMLPPALDDVEEFGEFTAVSDKNNDHISSPPTSSPPPPPPPPPPAVALYEGLLPPSCPYLTSNTPPPLEYDSAAHESSISASPPIRPVEAINSSITLNSRNARHRDEQSVANSDVVARNCRELPKTSKTEVGSEENVEVIENICSEAKSVGESMGTEPSVVSIEDIEDDSSEDELYSPKTPKKKNFTESEEMNDYFAIREVDVSGSKTESPVEVLKNCRKETVVGKEEVRDVSETTEHCAVESSQTTNPDLLQSLDINEDDDDDDFGDFADFQNFQDGNNTFSTASVDGSAMEVANTISTSERDVKLENVKEDLGDFRQEEESDPTEFGKDNLSEEKVGRAFDNSTEHLSAPRKTDYSIFSQPSMPCPEAHVSNEEESTFKNEKSGSEDDDFGDFNEAAPTSTKPTISTTTSTPSSFTGQSAQTPELSQSSTLSERISRVLRLMFPEDSSSSDPQPSEVVATHPKHNLPELTLSSIDAAKALEYQWQKSEMRHALIRSLGIDSRNILFGDKWNPMLPRFAANLSFDPLKPMKPQSAAVPSTVTETVGINELSQHSADDRPPTLKEEDDMDLTWHRHKADVETGEVVGEGAFSDDGKSVQVPLPLPLPVPVPYRENDELESLPTILVDSDKSDKINASALNEIDPLPEIINYASVGVLPYSAAKDVSPTRVNLSLQEFEFNESSETNESIDDHEVVVTSTFSGPLKETHIYTPSKTDDLETRNMMTTSSPSPVKAVPIDFDYEKAALGIIIDETVVKKEYRDIEYNPGFSLDTGSSGSGSGSGSSRPTMKSECYEQIAQPLDLLESETRRIHREEVTKKNSSDLNDETNDEFSDFQSVPSDISLPNFQKLQQNSVAVTSSARTRTDDVTEASSGVQEMILSPAVLLPQAIAMDGGKPKIEWGDAAANINPDELARIEELFPEPKTVKSGNSSSSQKSTPTHMQNSLSISAAVAHKENQNAYDDDDWSDFISVPISKNAGRVNINNNPTVKCPVSSPYRQQSPRTTTTTTTATRATTSEVVVNNSNDDEWSDFVSSAPPAATAPSTIPKVPQFNSGSWQNANFYNNPLSLYHRGPVNMVTNSPKQLHHHHHHHHHQHYYQLQQQQQQQQLNLINSNANNNSNSINNRNSANQLTTHTGNQHQYDQSQNNHQQQQQVHIMQNFSTAPVVAPYRLSAGTRSNQFQVGSAKVAPSIALIPDLGFVAPAIPTHTSFINSLPKPGINAKK